MTAVEPDAVVPTPAADASGVAASLQRHARTTWRYLRMHGARAHEADDLTQEAFLVALRKGVMSLPPAAVAAFLQRTARFLFLRHRRDETAAIELADAVDERWQRDAQADGGDALLARLRGCVDDLPGRARQAIRASYGLVDDREHDRAAVAHALGLQPDGLKTLLQRARALLRTCLERRTR